MPLKLDSVIDFIPRLQGDSLVFTVWKDNSPGVAGSLPPDSISSDNTLTLILLVSFVLLAVLISRSLPFLLHQVKNFFYIPRTDSATESETIGEVQLLYGLVVLGSLFMSFLAYLFISQHIVTSLNPEILLLPLLLTSLLVYYALKGGLTYCVSSVFFGSKKSLRWCRSSLLIAALQGILLFPALLLIVYFDCPVRNVVFYFVSILILAKLLSFYKSWSIFFRQNGGILQTFLYFCTLEIAPLLAFAGGMWTIIHLLKINY